MKPPKVKTLTYELIPNEGEFGHRLHALKDELIDVHHGELRDARIAIAWCTSWKPDVDGHVTLGKCVKASELHRELAPYDFVILLSRSFWEDDLVRDEHRRALFDHELCHARIKRDPKTRLPERDARGRLVYRTRKHDLEEFEEIGERYGCWKRDIERFGAAIERNRARRGRQHFVGGRSLQETLRQVGFAIPVDHVFEWSEQERRDIEAWAELRRDLGLVTFDATSPDAPAMPALLDDAVQRGIASDTRASLM